ncbi:ATP-binding cassette domain-containing protein [Bifidobacterium sp. ESL0732]|uniref:ATP-binding cassette domain-containing protein n=1 Tax=Bifidobacterium sp. ESL0732 TaxID=2983222 RepID=UPI0023F8E2AF|nr:ATP-binding cassette domain-containing protein [Bifidobacterium sp. ESL0732]WEV64194.1 ATP-binding cassette domain-containing protein [Bifidobacterium sp. ESL0732]
MSKNSDSKDEAMNDGPQNPKNANNNAEDTTQNDAQDTSAVKYDVVFDDDDDALDLGSLAASGQVSSDVTAYDAENDNVEDTDSDDGDSNDNTKAETADTNAKGNAKKSGPANDEADGKKTSDDGKANSDNSENVAASNAQRVNETLRLAVQEEDELSAHEAKSPVIEPATAISTRLDKETISEADILLKPNPTFALDHVTFTNRESGRNVLDNIDWGFFAGSLYAITNADDEQRRDFLAVASGFYRPDSGQVMVKSQSLLELETNEIRGHRIGLITQRYSLRDDLDALTNLTFTMRASGRTFLKPVPVAARDVLKYVDFDEAATGVKVSDLKPVDQRRLAIARAICCEATVILADDPVGGLDEGDRKVILDLLARIAHAQDPKRCVIVLVPGFGSETGESDDAGTAENADDTEADANAEASADGENADTDDDANATNDTKTDATAADANAATDSDEYASSTDYEAKADKVYSF